MSNRNLLDKTKDIVYPLIRKGITNDKVNQEIDLENSRSNNRLVDGRGLLEDNGSFSIDSDAKRYDDLLKTNNIEYFKKDDGDIRVSLIDTNNNLVNQFHKMLLFITQWVCGRKIFPPLLETIINQLS